MVLGPDERPPPERPDDPMGVENALVPPPDRSCVWYWELDVVWMPDDPDMPGEPQELGTCVTVIQQKTQIKYRQTVIDLSISSIDPNTINTPEF